MANPADSGEAALAAEPAEVRERVTLRAGSADGLAAVTGDEVYDVAPGGRSRGARPAAIRSGRAGGAAGRRRTAGATDPYRHLGQLAHLILRRAAVG
ncbi:MAG TPA: hypothetical protein VGH27_24375 [Streptosporangiaceae bacterium]